MSGLYSLLSALSLILGRNIVGAEVTGDSNPVVAKLSFDVGKLFPEAFSKLLSGYGGKAEAEIHADDFQIKYTTAVPSEGSNQADLCYKPPCNGECDYDTCYCSDESILNGSSVCPTVAQGFAGLDPIDLRSEEETKLVSLLKRILGD